MKSITSLAAIVLLRLPLDDVRPLLGIDSQAIENELKSRYGFSDSNQAMQINFPAGAPMVPQFGFGGPPMGTPMQFPKIISLASGKFEIGNHVIGINNLAIVPDFSFIKLDVVNTEDGDAIGDDIVNFLEEKFGFRNTKSKVFRNYGSSVLLQFDRPLETMIKAISKIQALVSPKMRESQRVNEDARIERLSFRCDPQQIPAHKSNFMDAFTIERRVGVDYSEDRYFSGAPMKTQDHINTLLEIEKAVLD